MGNSSTRGNWRSVWFGRHLCLPFADSDLPVPAKGPCPLSYGNRPVSKRGLRKFKDSYFGVTAAVRNFDQRQLEGLRAIPKARLLLESDAPYFPPGTQHDQYSSIPGRDGCLRGLRK